MWKMTKIAAVAVGLAAAMSASAGEVEVLHYWTSGGEAKSVAELKKIMQGKGHTWRDFAVAGGGGDSAMTVLKSRVISGNPPSAAQTKGPAIQEWASEGVLANMDTLAKAEKWDDLLPKVVADVMKYKGAYVAAPVNVHRVNWMWGSSEALKKAGVAAMPKTWDEFFAAADKLKAAGLVPVAHGGQNWQDFTTFESVVLGVGGPKFYQDALVKLDDKAINSDTMKKSLETFRRIKGYTDPGAPGRDWNLATAMLIQGKAGFQLMGDWAKGEFLAAGKAPGKDFLCAAAPGSANAFTFNVDSFILFKLKDAAAQKAQSDLASAIMSPAFQEVFNLNKGSIPVRAGQPMDKFDDCAKASAKDFVDTAKSGGLVPSAAHGMAIAPATEGAIKDVVSQFWNDDKVSVADAMKKIAAAAKTK
ncbi:MAG: carbohydrate ABC transporter substrate-binding protein [Acidovorax sp.]|jgi:glucose/mannose transport system substrate-binding protein|uniref:ABC transporter substrate-binding protein n=1 Tax=Acidovorax TaxID=12916 RepID=UPI0008694D1F|nr:MULTISPECIES: ABC transporter substrate-binding protein [unclassified Acidovorax]ODS61402.1 MAG: sugar ABC transporter substrate-binding protein [Acidovorax sp. SCN 65-108]OGA59673.1 MAG: sugar ABC transporter substrate-binding protein [Burkholderiales bacterium RIFCSPHIGHO2_01_FULL_64_960]OGA83555.1 MAG: sugar ABC transporter substrate-binding protein [Burkholderiales bacterium GWA2_64_37]OJV61602.1 MAG: sugar ABC transporter substrate-binding protein [Burkholderiales bacterium 64-34]MBT94